MLNKRGQFYLLAAIVIIAAIIGFAAVSNVVKKRGETTIFDIGKELSIEGARVIDFGTIQAGTAYAVSNVSGTLQNVSLIEHFTNLYDLYKGVDKEIFYIFGNEADSSLQAFKYSDLVVGTIDINVGGTFSGLEISQRAKESLTIDTSGGKIKATIEQITYEFDLKAGENFYFVISQDIDGERIVATG
ncbi:MAG: hypothetical protein ACE5ES_01205 [Candidatus Nanoarchaeia archaeon]